MGANSTKLQHADTTLATGLPKVLPPTFTVTIDGKVYTLAQLIAGINGRVDARTNVANARGAHKQALLALAAAIANSHVMVTGLKQVLLVMYASQPDVLAQMGLTPRKTAVKDVAAKSAAIAKSKATRALRHTMGSKQKAQIKAGVSAPAAAAPKA
jgi:hypothetical protein